MDHWATSTPDAVACIFGDQTITYRELRDQVDELAATLVGAGIRPGDRVAFLSTPRPEFWVSFLATVSVGGVWVGLNPRYQERELAHVITVSRPALVFGLTEVEGRTYRGELTRVTAQCGVAAPVMFDAVHSPADGLRGRGASRVEDAELRRRRDSVDPGSPALIVFTSGSTGAPKGAVLSDSGITSSFAIQAAHQLLDTPRVIANLPINHIAGVGDLCCTPLICGGSIVFQERFDPKQMLMAISTHRVTAIMQVPTTLKLLVEHPCWATTDLSSVQASFWGGGPLPETVAEAYRLRGIRLGSTYGMTEVTGSITYTDADANSTTVTTTVGRPIEQVEIKYVDSRGGLVPAGTPGEILVRHPGLLLEYFDDPAATDAAFDSDGFFRTGDLGVLQADGNLRLVGRRKEMYKSGGYNVYPREVELVLESFPPVRMAVVVPVSDPLYGEVGVAYCEASLEALDELADWCRSRLANYKVPKAFIALPDLPRLPIGKVDKQLLASRAVADIAEARLNTRQRRQVG
ncbi:class I adenylate-forming enzyme family protein [Leekyejoonella antrihumi]|uniref:Acyl--CoA ligase n=1 Tax=Leekyejoonella antrihumi TaxID=1660198 RepID=A0A563E7H8_9MICO|nr:class I adenylate-forming enzyme family protein [Leekyejoonella antrihumi]TWP38490.1 acyl--CoA ligase [Leekyejoonella antrihumi]